MVHLYLITVELFNRPTALGGPCGLGIENALDATLPTPPGKRLEQGPSHLLVSVAGVNPEAPFMAGGVEKVEGMLHNVGSKNPHDHPIILRNVEHMRGIAHEEVPKP
jgi:hypothetical protein